jgi:hypothetical protein
MAWTHFADVVKESNQLGRAGTSQALAPWTFGTLADRESITNWTAILTRWDLVIGHLACGTLCLPGVWFGGRRLQLVGALLLAGSGPMFFPVLYFHHEYYTFANGVFVLAALGIGLVVLMQQTKWYRRAAYVGLLAFFIVSCGRYYHDFYPRQRSHCAKQWFSSLLKAVQEETQPDDVIVVLGRDWSAEIPYYSQRRALMIPNNKLTNFIQNPEAYLKGLAGYRIGALVVYDPLPGHLRLKTVRRAVEAAHLNPACRFTHQGEFAIYSRKEGSKETNH